MTVSVKNGMLQFPDSNASQDYATHGYFRFFGKLPPVVTRHILGVGLNGATDGPVVDLMCGSGTTLVEAVLRGQDSVGIDVNPVCVLLSRVKTTVIPKARVASALREVLAGARSDLKSPTRLQAYIPDFRNRDYWFEKAVQNQLAALKGRIFAVSDPPVRDFLLVGFLAIIRRVSNGSPRIGRLFHIQHKEPPNVLELFRGKIDQMTQGMEDLAATRKPAKVSVVQGDARATPLPSASAGFAMVHPPYFALYKYSSDVLRFEMEWGGFSRGPVRELEIEDGFKTTDRGLFKDYISDMAEVLREGHRILKPGRAFCVVVSNSTLREERLPVVSEITKAAKRIGFRVDALFDREVRYAQASYHRSARADKKTDHDHLLFLRG